MHRNRVALAVLATTGLIATGCGSDDDTEPNSAGQSGAAEAGKADNAEPKRKSRRAQMVQCIEGELGSEVKSDGGPHRLSVKGANGKRQAVIVIHDDVGAARKAVGRTLQKGRNAVTFGRAEYIRGTSTDTEAGVIANCVALQYNRPQRR